MLSALPVGLSCLASYYLMLFVLVSTSSRGCGSLLARSDERKRIRLPSRRRSHPPYAVPSYTSMAILERPVGTTAALQAACLADLCYGTLSLSAGALASDTSSEWPSPMHRSMAPLNPA